MGDVVTAVSGNLCVQNSPMLASAESRALRTHKLLRRFCSSHAHGNRRSWCFDVPRLLLALHVLALTRLGHDPAYSCLLLLLGPIRMSFSLSHAPAGIRDAGVLEFIRTKATSHNSVSRYFDKQDFPWAG